MNEKMYVQLDAWLIELPPGKKVANYRRRIFVDPLTQDIYVYVWHELMLQEAKDAEADLLSHRKHSYVHIDWAINYYDRLEDQPNVDILRLLKKEVATKYDAKVLA